MRYFLAAILLCSMLTVGMSAEDASATPKKEAWVVKFYADWCRPCKDLDKSFANPQVKSILRSYANKSDRPYRVDIEKYDKNDVKKPETIMVAKYKEYLKKGIPLTMILDKKGKVYRATTGYMTVSQLKSFLERPIEVGDNIPPEYENTGILSDITSFLGGVISFLFNLIF